MKTKIVLASISALVISAVAFGQTSSAKIGVADITSEMQMHVCKNDERLDASKRLFKRMGAADDDLKIQDFGKVQNLTITKKGTTAETVIVGAHYDKVNEGCGAIDNWTGLVIVANLYGRLKNYQTNKTYVFVAFGNEEKGLVGSAAMAKAIPKEDRDQYCSMINFDSFGFAYPQVMTNASTPGMAKLAKDLAKEVNMPLSEAAINNADADSSSFVNKDIPAITFHGLSNKWQEYLHSSKDKIENVKPESVLMGYNFALLFVSRIDQGTCGMFRKSDH
jgi:Zn-dependent M28 family amino/carboxypeptidase